MLSFIHQLLSSVRRTQLLWMITVIIAPSSQALADFKGEQHESIECVNLLRAPLKTGFRSPMDEISYTNRYNSCWADSVLLNARTAERSFIGKGVEIFANPALIEASGFSKLLCKEGGSIPGFREDYPCWFEIQNAGKDVSIEQAARKEAPKILFANSVPDRDGSESVEYILCTNDDPTKSKEYSKSCRRGKTMLITEYGRGDINNDHDEDILVNIKYGNIDDDRKKCFIAGFTRKEGQLMHMITFSHNGLCE